MSSGWPKASRSRARWRSRTPDCTRASSSRWPSFKQTQAQLVQSTKLAAIGELAANIAHEINNPLTTVLGFASFIAERLPAEDPMREELGLIQEGGFAGPRHRARPAAVQPAARLHARARGPQHGPWSRSWPWSAGRAR